MHMVVRYSLVPGVCIMEFQRGGGIQSGSRQSNPERTYFKLRQPDYHRVLRGLRGGCDPVHVVHRHGICGGL